MEKIEMNMSEFFARIQHEVSAGEYASETKEGE